MPWAWTIWRRRTGPADTQMVNGPSTARPASSLCVMTTCSTWEIPARPSSPEAGTWHEQHGGTAARTNERYARPGIYPGPAPVSRIEQMPERQGRLLEALQDTTVELLLPRREEARGLENGGLNMDNGIWTRKKVVEAWKPGGPVAQGSLKAWRGNGMKFAKLTSTAKGLKQWRALVANALVEELRKATPPF